MNRPQEMYRSAYPVNYLQEEQEFLNENHSFAQNLVEKPEELNKIIHEEEVINERELLEEENLDEECLQNKYNLRSRDVEALLSLERKRLIFSKITEKTKHASVVEQIKVTSQEIEELQKQIELRLVNNEELEKNVEIDHLQLNHLKKNIQNTGEVISALIVFVKKLEVNLKNSNIEELLSEINKQNEKFNHYFKKSDDTIANLTKEINNIRKTKNPDSGRNDYTDKNLVLKQKIIQKQEQLNQLKEKVMKARTDKELKLQIMNDKRNEQTKLLSSIESTELKLAEMKLLCNQKQQERDERVNSLENEREIITQNIKLANEQKTEIDKNLENAQKQVKEYEEKISFQLVNNTALEDRAKELRKEYNNKKGSLDANKEMTLNELQNVECELSKIENEVLVKLQEKTKFENILELLRNEYIGKLEEHNANTMKKLELEHEIKAFELQLNQYKQENYLLLNSFEGLKNSKEQLQNHKQSVDECLKQEKIAIENIQSSFNSSAEKITIYNKTRMDDLKKKKMYAITSTQYLEEKLKHFETDKEQWERLLKIKRNKLNDMNNAKFLKDKKLNDLTATLCNIKKEFECLRNLRNRNQSSAQDPDIKELNPNRASILKSPGKVGVSPKKVSFQGIPSATDSTNSSEFPLDETAPAPKTFDELFNELTSQSKSESNKNPKRRRVQFD